MTILKFLLIITICATHLHVRTAAVSERNMAAAPPCPTAAQQSISASCAWSTREVPATGVASLAGAVWRPSLPELLVSNTTPVQQPSAVAAAAGFTLNLRRVVLIGATLVHPAALGVPKLWPLGLFAGNGTNLTMTDVHIHMSGEVLQTYINFFKPVGRQGIHALQLHSDGFSFLHIAGYADERTSLQSVTLLAGPCSDRLTAALVVQRSPSVTPADGQPLSPAASSASVAAAAAAVGQRRVCNVYTVDNATLVPVLAEQAAVPTQQPMLLLIVSNVSLGAGLSAGAIDVRRPVVVAGLHSIPLSVDLGMVVNQLNVTAPYSRLFWQSVYLENAAPGDATSSIMAPPYSAAVSANVYAMYCNRSKQHCLNLYNVTLVLATEQELDYMMFMFSMFNSPLPNMRQHAKFYETDLNMTVLEMGPAEDISDMNIFNLSSSCWSILDSLFALQPFVAGKLPLPPGAPKITDTTRAAPSVQAITDCRDFQAALRHTSTDGRLHVWWLLNNVTLAPSHNRDCWQLKEVNNPSQIYGSIDEFGQAPVVRGLLADSALGGPRPAWRPRLLAGTGSSADASRVPGFKVHSLGFSYLQAAFALSLDSQDRFMQITNVTLHQLPQGPSAPSAVSGRMMPADVWALLLWPINRTMGGSSPVYVADAVIMLPQQEFDSLSNAALDRSSFVVQLADNLTLTIRDLVHEGSRMKLGFFQGPGIIGSNVWLLPDPASTTAMPQPYNWPFTALIMTNTPGAANTSGRSQLSEILGAVLGTVVGVLLVMAAVCYYLYWVRQRRQRQWREVEMKQGGDVILPGALEGSGSELAPRGTFTYSRQSSTGMSGAPACTASRSVKEGLAVPQDVFRLADSVNKGSSFSSSRRLSPGLLQVPEHNLHSYTGVRDFVTDINHPHLGHQRSNSSPQISGPLGGSSSTGGGIAQGPVAGSWTAGAADQHVSEASAGDAIALGLKRWSVAVSSTLRMMERGRSHAAHLRSNAVTSVAVGGTSMAAASARAAAVAAAAAVVAAAAAAGTQTSTAAPSSAAPHGSSDAGSQQSVLQLHQLLGQGSFGCVYLGTWLGKRVAVKVMQLPASALLKGTTVAGDGQRLGQQFPHMAIVETVISRAMSHPNVVQVYTYMFNALKVEDTSVGSTAATTADASSGKSSNGQQQQQQEEEDRVERDTSARKHGVSGWELKLVMEYCDQGTLREALDRRRLQRGPHQKFLIPALVLSLAHDVAAAMLHLHSDGVVHGDLKAGNVMLTK